MRWFFLLLLLLNFGYVAWELNRERPQQSVRTAVPDGVETIVLLSELASDPPEDSQAVRAEAGEPVPADASDPSVTAAQQAQAGASGPPSPPTMAATADQGDRQLAATVTQKRDAGAVATAAPGPAGDRCYTLGPFSDMKTLRQVTRDIKDYVVEASFRSKDEQEQTMFRVLISPLGSKEEAKALIKELNSKNIRDHFIITEGAYKNAVSLGYFSSKDRAYRYAARVRRLGFDAEAEPVFRSYTIYWLDYRIRAGSEIPQQIFDRHIQNATRRLNRACG